MPRRQALEQLFAEFADGLFDAVEVRVEAQGFFVGFDGFVRLAQVGVAMTEAGPGAEMRGHQSHGLKAVEHGRLEFFLEVVGDGALIVRFGKIGRELDGAAEMLEGAIKFAIGKALRASGKFLIGGRRSASKPDGPEGVLGHLIGHRVGIFEAFGDGRGAAGSADE